MNIFYLDEDVTLCAQYHCDKHVIKMILESAQILCTVLHQNNLSAPYRAPVKAYRNYYIHAKSNILTWKKRGPPDWYYV